MERVKGSNVNDCCARQNPGLGIQDPWLGIDIQDPCAVHGHGQPEMKRSSDSLGFGVVQRLLCNS